MRRRVLAILSSVAILASSAIDVTAHAAQIYHYYQACATETATDTGPHGVIWDRHVYNYTAVRMTIPAQRLDPCTAGNATYHSTSLQWADLQGNQAGHSWNLAQLGLGKINYASGLYQCSGANQMQNDQTSFVWTPNITNQVFCRASWVDFNNDGTPDNPVANEDYTFTIQAIFSGSHSGTWQFSVKRVSDGAIDYAWVTRTSGAYVPQVWWGCEIGNTANQLGVPRYSTPAWLAQPSYIKTTSSSWIYTEDSVVAWEPWLGGVGEYPKRWYYNTTSDQSVLGEQIDCHTDSHNTA